MKYKFDYYELADEMQKQADKRAKLYKEILGKITDDEKQQKKRLELAPRYLRLMNAKLIFLSMKAWQMTREMTDLDLNLLKIEFSIDEIVEELKLLKPNEKILESIDKIKKLRKWQKVSSKGKHVISTK